jgi:hypothetical protein
MVASLLVIQLADMATALRVWLVAAAIGFFWLPAQTGSIAGKITDATGGVIPGATVTARFEGRTQTAVTNVKGEYRLDLPQGRYRIEAALSGFATAYTEDAIVEAARTTTWNATLQVFRRGVADPWGDFQARVTRIVGPDAVDCGQHRLSRPRAPAALADFQKSLACGLDAVEQKKAFWMSFQVQGTDSTIFRGVAGTTASTIYRPSYDSDPSGGGGSAPRFSAEVCAKPSISMSRDGYAAIVCSRP